MANILVTGATGFIGKNLLELLLSNGENIIAFSNGDKRDIDILKGYGVNNICFEKDLKKSCYSIDYCIHLASYGVKYADKNLEEMIDVNINLSSQIMLFCINNGCKVFINTGSCFEYGAQNTELIDETSSLNPEDFYAATKVANAIILRTIAQKEGIQIITCRPFGVFGKYEANGRILPIVYHSGIKQKQLKLTEGLQERDYLYVKDVVCAFYEILKSHNNFKMIDDVNICSGIACTIKSFVQKIITIKKFDSSLFLFGDLPYRKNESMRIVGNNEKLKTLTNWHQKYTLEEGLQDYFIHMEESIDGLER